MKNTFLFLLILLFYANIYSQNMTSIVDEIKAKGKDNAIKMAFNLLEEKQPSILINPKDYDIKVLADSEEVTVLLRRIIKYVPLRFQTENKIKYDIKVNLIRKTISPFDDTFNSIFYIPTNEDLEVIAFVQKNFGIFSPNFETTISEEENDYVIHLENQYSYGKYSINKKTGKEGPALQGSYLPAPKTLLKPENNTILEITN
jgi:hypothetical protein